MALTKFFNKFALIAATLLLSVLVFAPQVDAGTAGQTSYYVVTNETKSGGAPRIYSYGYGGSPKNKWGTSSKPYSTIESALDDAAYHGNKNIFIYFCDKGTPWASGTSSSAYKIQSTYKSLNTVRILPKNSSGCSSIRYHDLLVPDYSVSPNLIKNLQIGYPTSSGSFKFTKDLDVDADLNLTLYGNSFNNAIVSVSPSYPSGTTSTDLEYNTFDGVPSTYTAPSVFLKDLNNVELWSNTYKNSTVGMYGLNSEFTGIHGETFEDAKMTLAGSYLQKMTSTTFDGYRGLTLNYGSHADEIAGVSFTNTSTTSGSIAFTLDDSTIDNFWGSDFSLYEKAVNIVDGAYADAIYNNDFYAPSAGNAQVYVDDSTFGEMNTNNFMGTGYGSAYYLDGGSYGEYLSYNDVQFMSRAFDIADGEVTYISHSDVHDVDYPIYVDNGLVKNVQHGTYMNGDTAITCTRNCEIDTVFQNEFDDYDTGIHILGSMDSVEQNNFFDFRIGVLAEAVEDAFEDHHRGIGEDLGSMAILDTQLVLTNNVFDNGGGPVESNPGLGQETIAVAAAHAKIDIVELNSYENTHSFAILHHNAEIPNMYGNYYDTAGVGMYSSYPALGVYDGSSVFADQNYFHNRTTNVPMHFTVIEVESAAAEIVNAPHFAFDTVAYINLDGYDVSFSGSEFSAPNYGVDLKGSTSSGGAESLFIENSMFHGPPIWSLCELFDF